MNARPEYKVMDPVPLNQDSGLVRPGNGTSISTARLRSKLVSTRHSSAVRESRPAFFFPLNRETMSCWDPVGWWSLVRDSYPFLIRNYSLYSVFVFDCESNKAQLFWQNANGATVSVSNSFVRFGSLFRVNDVSRDIVWRAFHVKLVSIKKRDCRYNIQVRSMRLVQLLVTHGLVLLLTLLVPCLSVTFEDGTSDERSEVRGKIFHIWNKECLL